VRNAYVLGVGIGTFGKYATQTLGTLGRRAGELALRDAGISPQQVEMIACGCARSGVLQGRESGVGQLIGWELGIQGVPVYNEKAYCASGSMAFNVATMAVAGGFHDISLVIGVEKMSSRTGKGRPLTSDGMELEGEIGFTPSVYYAMAAKRHMSTYGTTRDQIATVAVKNRRAAALNPAAQYRTPITIEDVRASRPVSEPLHLFDCCPTGDGAAAAVIVSEDALRRLGYTANVRIAASVVGTGLYEDQQRDLSSFGLDRRTASAAYEQAGIAPTDVSVAEVHDSFSIAEIIHYEDLGFCAPGEGGRLVESGATALGGKLPVSTSGGLLNRGHPLGATGVAQIVELTEQLQGRSGRRQVRDARIGLAHISGGFHEGDFATTGVTILERVAA
jgi:acetyl-CoA acyltransferase